jgi:hypothetical protein
MTTLKKAEDMNQLFEDISWVLAENRDYLHTSGDQKVDDTSCLPIHEKKFETMKMQRRYDEV